MATEAQIFDFETAIERAVQTVFEATGIVTWTPGDDPALKKHRPRVELAFIPGPATGHLQPSAATNTVFWAKMIELGMTLADTVKLPPLVHDAYTGILQIAAFTKASHAEHIAYRARVRHVASALIYFADPEHHEVTDVTAAGTSNILQPEEGLYESRLQYNLTFCVKHTSWPVSTA